MMIHTCRSVFVSKTNH